jgi:hypothetical protein
VTYAVHGWIVAIVVCQSSCGTNHSDVQCGGGGCVEECVLRIVSQCPIDMMRSEDKSGLSHL